MTETETIVDEIAEAVEAVVAKKGAKPKAKAAEAPVDDGWVDCGPDMNPASTRERFTVDPHWTFQREINCAGDAGYRSNLPDKVLSMARQALSPDRVNDGDVAWGKFPQFHQFNRIRVTVEVIPHLD